MQKLEHTMGMLSQSMRDSSLPKRILMEIVVQRFPKRFEDFSFPLIKQLLKNCRPCGVQNQEYTQQMLFLSLSEKFVAFFLAAHCLCWWSSHSLSERMLRGGVGSRGSVRHGGWRTPALRGSWTCPGARHFPSVSTSSTAALALWRNARLFCRNKWSTLIVSQSKSRASGERMKMHQPDGAPRAPISCLPSTQKALPDLSSTVTGVKSFWRVLVA